MPLTTLQLQRVLDDLKELGSTPADFVLSFLRNPLFENDPTMACLQA